MNSDIGSVENNGDNEPQVETAAVEAFQQQNSACAVSGGGGALSSASAARDVNPDEPIESQGHRLIGRRQFVIGGAGAVLLAGAAGTAFWAFGRKAELPVSPAEVGSDGEKDKGNVEPFSEVYETAGKFGGTQIIAEQQPDGSYHGRVVGLAPNGTNQYTVSRSMTAEPVGLIAESALDGGSDTKQARAEMGALFASALYRPNQSFNTLSQAGYSAEQSRAIAEEMFERANAEREKQGLEPYIWDELLYQMAQLRASQLQQSFSHNMPDGRYCEELLTDFSLTKETCFGENVGMGASTPESVVNGWMNSKGHRSNILNKYQYSATAVYVDEKGRKYYTQVFYGWEPVPDFHVPPPSETGKPPAYLTNPTAPETTPPEDEDIPVIEVPNIREGEDGVPIIDGLNPTPGEDGELIIEIPGPINIIDNPDDPFKYGDGNETPTVIVDDDGVEDINIEPPINIYHGGVTYGPIVDETNAVIGYEIISITPVEVGEGETIDDPLASAPLPELSGHPINGIAAGLAGELTAKINGLIASGGYDEAIALAIALSSWASNVDPVFAGQMNEAKTAAETAKAQAAEKPEEQPAKEEQPAQDEPKRSDNNNNNNQQPDRQPDKTPQPEQPPPQQPQPEQPTPEQPAPEPEYEIVRHYRWECRTCGAEGEGIGDIKTDPDRLYHISLGHTVMGLSWDEKVLKQ
jgi:uncharacterized protein YkwD